MALFAMESVDACEVSYNRLLDEYPSFHRPHDPPEPDAARL
jgi:hypothetical protein